MAKRRTNNKKSKATNGIVVEHPRPTDVLFGRGGHVNHNPANQRYLKLVCERKEEYDNCKKTDKADIAWDIIRVLREEQDPPVRFLKKDYSTNMWHIVEDTDVRRKISQCLRERGVPVCPKAKRSKEAKAKATASMPKLRLSPRATSQRVVQEEKQGKSDSEDEWQPSEETLPPLTGTVQRTAQRPRRVTRLGKQLETVLEVQGSEEPVGQTPPSPSTSEESQGILCLEGSSEVASRVVSTSNAGPFVPPPLPARAPIRQEGSNNNRVWSDFLTKSFASFAPSIFDFSNGVENAWEDLLDTKLLPQLAPEDDQSHSSEEQAVVDLSFQSVQKRSISQSSSYSVAVECLSPCKRRKTQADDDGLDVEPTPVHSLFTMDHSGREQSDTILHLFASSSEAC